jgi:hypothetical protein
MKTYVCKSVKNAIRYFEQNSTRKVDKTINGEEYVSVVPPKGFKKLIVRKGSMDFVYEDFQWFDYAAMLSKDGINEITLYYTK